MGRIRSVHRINPVRRRPLEKQERVCADGSESDFEGSDFKVV